VAATATRAEATTLICHLNTNLSPFVEDQPTTVELNETQSTVIVHIGAGHHSDPYWSSPSSTIGPMQATFTADTISFPSTAGDSFTIDRLTGAMHGAGGDWICQPGKALF